MAFVACTQNEVEELSANREALPETLTVGFEGDDTRVELNEALKTVWTEGDEVSVFYRSYENMKWAFQGATGDRSGELKRVSGEVGDNTMDNTIVVYPYNEDYKINLSEGGVEASLPAVQSYKEGSYGKEGNIMVAESTFTQFVLKSVVGWLRVELTGEGEVVESITVRGNGDEQLAGLCYIDAEDASVTLASNKATTEEDGEIAGNINFDGSTFTEVTLDCGEGVELGTGTTYFYIALLPQNFESGITIEVNYGDDALKIERVNSNLTIQRNHIYPINIAANEEVPSNELWYTSTDGNIVEPYNSTAFDVAIRSNEYANGQGVITFDGDVTLISAEAFRECNTLESISLPDGITEVVEGSFRGCSNLTSFSSKLATANRRALIVDKTLVAFAPKGVTKYTIPAGVARIGAYTFAYSTELLDVTIGNGVEVIGAWSFTRCSELKRAYIASSVHTIEEGAFSYCNKLVIEGDNYESVVGGIIDKDGKWRGPIDIPDDGKIEVGKGVITIGEGAVRNNDGITEVTIPESVQEIEAWAFMGCTSLEKVICKPTTPPAAIFTDGLWQAFDENAPERKIYVPAASLDTYKAANGWKDYADSIFALDNGEEEPDEEWISLGEGFYRDDILASLSSTDVIGVIVPVEIAQHHEDKSRYRLIDPYSREAITYIWGGVPSNMVFTSPGYIEFVIDPATGNVEIPNSPLGFQMDFGDGNGALDISVQLLTDANNAPLYGSYDEDRGIIEFTTRSSIGFVNTMGKGYYVNSNALFAIAMPGYDFDEPIDSEGSKIYYTATAKVEPYDTSDFNAAIVSNEWDEAAGKGVITFDGELTTIGNYAFEDCQSMTSITIPDSVTTLGWGAFTGCSTLREFSGKFATDDGLCLITDNILKAFAIGCGITEYTIPNNVTSIEANVFMECMSLTSVTIPDSVTTIGSYTFTWCKNLTTISIGSGVTSIGYAAFVDCNSLTSVYCKATTPPTLDGNGFHDNADGRKIYVPTESVEEYKTAEYWSDYATDIVGYDFDAGEGDVVKSELFYTATALVEPYKSSAFNVAIVSNEWDEATGEGIITFDGELTTIGDYAFEWCDSLTSVTIPDSVTTIGDSAFEGCDSLTSVTIPDSVTTIGDRVFLFNQCLTSVTIPDSVTRIGSGAFGGCISLAEFTGKFAEDGGRCLIIDGVLNAYAAASGTTYTIPDYVTTIGEMAFYYCESLTSVTIPNGVTTIGKYAFDSCVSLTSVTIGNSVTTIGEAAFASCSSLTSVTIPDSVTTIGELAFCSCYSLTSVTIPDSVTTIGGAAFYGCISLAEFTGKFAEDGGRCLIIDGVLNAFALGCGVTEYTIPDSVTTMGYWAFAYCESLTSVSIPDSVTTIGDYAFDSCVSLTSITIPDSVTTIGNYAFEWCDSLTSVTIGDSVTTIGVWAFAECDRLTSVYCKATTPPKGINYGYGWIAFDDNASGRKIYVPAESVEAYKAAAGWSDYAADIVGYDFE